MQLDPFIATDNTLRLGQLEELVQRDLMLNGAEINYTLPGGFWHRIRGGTLSFDAKAQVANRYPRFRITDGNSIIYHVGTGNAVTANQSEQFNFLPGSGSNLAPTTAYLVVTIPDMWLPPGAQLQTNTLGLQSLDRWVTLGLYVERIDRDVMDWYLGSKHYGKFGTLHSSTPPA